MDPKRKNICLLPHWITTALRFFPKFPCRSLTTLSIIVNYVRLVPSSCFGAGLKFLAAHAQTKKILEGKKKDFFFQRNSNIKRLGNSTPGQRSVIAVDDDAVVQADAYCVGHDCCTVG